VYRGGGGLQQVELAEAIRNRRRSSAIRPVARALIARRSRNAMHSLICNSISARKKPTRKQNSNRLSFLSTDFVFLLISAYDGNREQSSCQKQVEFSVLSDQRETVFCVNYITSLYT